MPTPQATGTCFTCKETFELNPETLERDGLEIETDEMSRCLVCGQRQCAECEGVPQCDCTVAEALKRLAAME